MVYFTFLTFDPTSHLSLKSALTVLVMGSLGFVVPVQGGIGAYHAAVIQGLLVYGISETDADIFALISHSFQMIVFIVVGSVCLFIVSRYHKKIKTDEAGPATGAETV